jgi:hypothetical protein
VLALITATWGLQGIGQTTHANSTATAYIFGGFDSRQLQKGSERKTRYRLRLEMLEDRLLLNASVPPVIVADPTYPGDTPGDAFDISTGVTIIANTPMQRASVVGSRGQGLRTPEGVKY